MPKGISLHIGLNRVNPNHYQDAQGKPWDGRLNACEFDAEDMESLARKQGFDPRRKLLTEAATADAVIAAIRDSASELVAGDLFLLTYSGHGGQVPDTNHDEEVLPTGGQEERMDETWVLFDRQLVDDELYALWAEFQPGVRIVVLADCCHSGTVTRNGPPDLTGMPRGTRVRCLPPGAARRTFKAHKKLYTGVQEAVPTAEEAPVGASVVLLSGCQDNQLSLDGPRNGLFTATLKRVWRNGRFSGTYRLLRDTIASGMPPSQTPNYYVVGTENPGFEAQAPFTI